MEKSILVEKINIAYSGSVATREIIESYIGKARIDWTVADLDSKTILDAYTADCNKYCMWRLRRQVTDSKSESLAGWKACKSAAENILKTQPSNERALELLKAAVVYNRISTMIATIKGELKKPATTATVTEDGEDIIPVWLPTDCPVTSVFDLPEPTYVFPVIEHTVTVSSNRQAIEAIIAKATEKSSKQELLAIIAEIKAIA